MPHPKQVIEPLKKNFTRFQVSCDIKMSNYFTVVWCGN